MNRTTQHRRSRRSAPKPAAAHVRRLGRPESLEERVLLSAVTWTIDQAASHLTLDLPTQEYYLGDNPAGLPYLPVKGTDQAAVPPYYMDLLGGEWTTGNDAHVSGIIETNYEEGVSIEFLSTSTAISAVPSVSAYPDPADFSLLGGANSDGNFGVAYPGGTINADYGGALMTTDYAGELPVGVFTMTDTKFKFFNSDPMTPLSISSGVFAATGTSGTLDSGDAHLFLDPVFVDVLGAGHNGQYLSLQPFYAVVNSTTGDGTITDLGGGQRQLTLPVELDGLVISDGGDGYFIVDVSGVIVATATVSQPALILGPVSLAQAEGDAGPTSYIFDVTLTGSSSETITVVYSTSDGTATAGSDYAATTGTLTFAPGQTSQGITVLVDGDTANETDEDFTVSLSAPVNATVIAPTATGLIQNDDPLPVVGFSPTTVAQAEGHSGTTDFVFSVSLSAASGQTVTVRYDAANGTSSGTVLVKDIQMGSGSASPIHLTNVNGTLFFQAYDPASGYELWKSDGTSAGTVLVKDIFPGSAGSQPQYLTNVNGTLYFAANDGTHGFELWKSDGTSAGTSLVSDILAGSADALEFDGYFSMAEVGGTLYFPADDGTHGEEVWKTDGTSAGTVMVDDIQAGSAPSSPEELANIGGTLFFSAYTPAINRELWKSDGTSAGTVLVKDIRPGAPRSSPESLTNVNGTLFFTARDATHGYELWKSDGTSSGTVLVKDINPSTLSSPWPRHLTNVNGTLFFSADNDTNGYQLWKSDGTSSGTIMVAAIDPFGGSYPNQLVNVNGTLFFTAFHYLHGYELWKTTGSGPVLVKEINPGAPSSNPANLTNANGNLFFSAYDSVLGNELWTSDGTSYGTVRIKDIFPGSLGSDPSGLVAVGGTLFFSANDGTHGNELWRSVGNTSLDDLIFATGTLTFASGQTLGTATVKVYGDTVVEPNEGFQLVLSSPVNATLGSSSATGIIVNDDSDPAIVARRLFYNRSSFDGNNASINTSDDVAIATDKTAYLPGDGLAVFDNVSSYSRGINGIMIDLVGSVDHSAISLSTLANDFVFKVGNNNTPSGWAAAPTPNAVSVRTNFDGSGTDRITITWTDGDIKNQWLEVQVLPTGRTGLTSTDVFFWGNKIGDIGNPTPSAFSTTAAGDAGPIISGGLGPAGGITNPRDIDRSNVITAAGDRGAATSNIGAIVRIDIGTGGPFAPTETASHDAARAAIASALAAASPAKSAPRVLPRVDSRRSERNHSPSRQHATYFEQLATAAGHAPDNPSIDGSEIEDLLDLIALSRNFR